VLWDHLRIDRRKGPRLIDYHGQDGMIAMGGIRYSPKWDDPNSREHQTFVDLRDQDPDQLKIALRNFFRI